MYINVHLDLALLHPEFFFFFAVVTLQYSNIINTNHSIFIDMAHLFLQQKIIRD